MWTTYLLLCLHSSEINMLADLPLNDERSIGSLNATDADLGRNGSVSYRIATSNDQSSGSRNHFSSDHTVSERPGSNLVQITQDGQIKIYGVLDREQFPMVMVDVIAEDNGTPTRLSSMITLTIHVLDLNDNKPRFVATSRESSDLDIIAGKDLIRFTQTPTLLEPVQILNISLDTSIGTVLVKFEGVDPDEGPNGTVVYELIHPASSATYRRDPPTIANEGDSSSIESSDHVPTFTLHPDGRLVLSKQLTFEEIYSPSTQSITKRYRRPDKLLIRATDRGPSPEQAVTGVHVFYHDPLTIINVPTAVISQAVLDGDPVAVHHFNEPTISLTKSTANNQRTSLRAHPKSVAHNTGASGNGIPIIYMLALAVFFALVLVVTSLIYLYTKVKRPNRVILSQEKDEDGCKSEINGSRCVVRRDKAFGAVQIDGSMRNDTPSGSTENDLGIRYPRTVSSPVSDRMTSVEHYRTLSPSYLKRDARDSQVNKNGSDNSTNCAPRWNTTFGPGYTELTACHVFHSRNSAESSPRVSRQMAEHLQMPFTSHYPPVMTIHPQRQPTFLEAVHISRPIPQVSHANQSISRVSEKPIKTFVNGYSNPMPSLAGSFHLANKTLSKTCTPVPYDDLIPTDDLLRSQTSFSTTSTPIEKNRFAKNKTRMESVPSIKESTRKPNVCQIAASFV
ncbi:hypothetical protein PHET_00575 [Paragonimus heterotremus]|uniref:Cadherin domain-containing protein n=1 Tax=Paragonimus heterotremus TaxID=100268 RepID=A0A8J4TFI9_9TREM|nr:hypothetical protein PHET_00575 [Paragonimus heterotremus]